MPPAQFHPGGWEWLQAPKITAHPESPIWIPDTPLTRKDFASLGREQQRCAIWTLLAVGKSLAAAEGLGEAH